MTTRGGHAVRLLIIDDSAADRDLYRRFLRDDPAATYLVEEADSGETGLALIQNSPPDMILLDYGLPGCTGIEVLSTLRVVLASRLTPIIMLTGQGDESIAVDAMKRGAQDYVVKGQLTAERLRHAIASALENSRLRAEIQIRCRELEDRNRQLQDYASAIAHDLRSPLQSILLSGEIVLLQHGADLPPEAHRHLERLVNSATRMGKLLGDLLEYARAGVTDRPPELVDIGAVVAELAEDLGPQMSEQGAVLEVGPLPTLPGHRILIRQLFQNLIGNALKFRGAADPIVRVSARQDGAAWHVTVSDNGMGIHPSQRESIFRVFQRGLGSEHIEGTGIGLAICRKIVDQADGSIDVESTLGRGSAFHVVLPAQRTHGESGLA